MRAVVRYRAALQTKEKGASSCLTVIPIQEHGFSFTKSEFKDALPIDSINSYKEYLVNIRVVKNTI